MTEATHHGPRIALLTTDAGLTDRLREALSEYELTTDPGRASVVLAEIRESGVELDPDLPVRAAVVAVIPTNDFALSRDLFRRGVVDVIARDAEPGTIRRAIMAASRRPPRNAAHGLSAELLYLREMSQAASEGKALSALFDRIVEIVTEILGVDIVSLLLMEEQITTRRRFLRIKAARGLPAEIISETQIEPGERISGLVAASGEPLLIPNVEVADLGISRSHPRYRTKGLLSVPIKVRSQIIGVLNVNNKVGGDSFDENDLALLSTICNQAGLAIDNARLYEELRDHAARMATLNFQLERVSRAKSELIVNLTHEIKTPLTAIQGYVDLLRSGVVEPGRTRQILERVHDRTRHLGRLAERLTTFFALDSGGVKVFRQDFPLDVLAFKCAEEIQAVAANRQVKLHVDGESLRHRVSADRQHYRELLLALLDNAVKFNRAGGSVRVHGVLHPEDGKIEVFVRDTGPGVPTELHESMFDDFKQTNDIMTAKPDGLGIGLAISRAVAESHGCHLHLVESSDQGSTFAFTVPLAAVKEHAAPSAG